MNNVPIKALLLDMDGVIWRGATPLGDLASIFNGFSARGLKVGFATNNATISTAAVQAKLAGFGIITDQKSIVTSAEASGLFLQKRFPSGGAIYVIGEDGLRSSLAEMGFIHQEDGSHAYLAVVIGLDRQFNYDKLMKANRIIRQGALFIATNPDKTFPAPDGLVPGAGSLVAALETASETSPIIIGKPFPTLFEILLDRLGVTTQETLVVGDRFDTDIVGGQRAGCRTALVLTGVTTRAEALKVSPAPDLITESLTTLLELLP